MIFNLISRILVFYSLVFFAPSIATAQEETHNRSIPTLRDADKVKFYLYQNPNVEDESKEMVENNLEDSGYNNSRPLILLVHGILSNYLTLEDVQQVKNAYLAQRVPANIIMVDYGPLGLAGLPVAFTPLSIFPVLLARSITEIVAEKMVSFLQILMRAHEVTLQRVHLIGFSLGAHMSGLVGRYLYKKTGTKVNRISGLDPSPQYLGAGKLEPDDADFVDVTLTSLGSIANAWGGEGDVQFYMNGGGPHQLNCPNLFPFTETYCSHTSSVFYFAKSIKNRNIPACGCTDILCKTPPIGCPNSQIYGHHVNPEARGQFYVALN